MTTTVERYIVGQSFGPVAYSQHGTSAREKEREREESRRSWSDLTRPPGRRRDSAKTNQVWLGNAVSLRGLRLPFAEWTRRPFLSLPRSLFSSLRALLGSLSLHLIRHSPLGIAALRSHSIFSPQFKALIEILPKRVLDEFIPGMRLLVHATDILRLDV